MSEFEVVQRPFWFGEDDEDGGKGGEKPPEDKADSEHKPDDDAPESQEIKGLTQEKLDELIDRAYARGAKNSADAKKLKKLEDELNGLKEFKANVDRLAKKGKENPDDQRLQEEIAAIREEYEGKLREVNEQLETARTTSEKQVNQVRETQLKNEVIRAAHIANATDPEDVFTLMQARGLFKYDDEDGWVAVGDKGRVRIDVEDGGKPLSIAKAVVDFVSKKPGLKKASGRTGSGQGSGGNGSDREVAMPEGLDIDRMSPSDLYRNKDRVLDWVRGGGRKV